MLKTRPGNRRCGHIDHNALCLPPPKFCITIVFDFRWDDCNNQEKLETMVIQFSFFLGGGRNKVHYGLCENGECYFKVNFSSLTGKQFYSSLQICLKRRNGKIP